MVFTKEGPSLKKNYYEKMSLSIKEKQQRSVPALNVSKRSTRGFFSVACWDFFFLQIRAVVTSFSTLYFSYVSHPRNFIGQSTRVIQRVKWRGWPCWVGSGTSRFPNQKVKRYRPERCCKTHTAH